MKLWQKDVAVSRRIDTFTVGKDRELDVLLARYDVLGTLAHIQMLQTIQLLTKSELDILTAELQNIYTDIEAGNFEIEAGVEDVHSQVELMLTRTLGDLGKKIHSGRSRNDQVLLDLKLFIRAELQETVEAVQTLFEQFISLSEQYKDALMPGYTHYQIAMPSSFGLWFGAYAESLVDDVLQLQTAFRISNKNPLGSAAGYGSSFPLNRTMTTDLLGFDTLNYNVVYAQMGRGKTERVVSEALASVAATLAKFAQDVCLYMSQNFGFVTFPEHLTTNSNIMPHKKNPDVFELVRAKCNKIMALPNEIMLLTANLPAGYHRDLQIIKESFLPVFATLQDCIEITTHMLQNIIVNRDAIKDDKYKYLFSVEVVNELVLSGTSFRDAYVQVGRDIASDNFTPSTDINHTHEGSIGNLCNDKIQALMQAAISEFPFSKIAQAESQLLTPTAVLA
jgi:argininosuccinate lyase